MSSFKVADYESIRIFGYEGVYTKNQIEDELPKGFYRYSLMFNGEQRMLLKDKVEDCEATIITKEAILSDDYSEVYETDLIFMNNEFSFENFFDGIHRPIDYQIQTAEDKKNEQFQSKDRSKTKTFSQELM